MHNNDLDSNNYKIIDVKSYLRRQGCTKHITAALQGFKTTSWGGSKLRSTVPLMSTVWSGGGRLSVRSSGDGGLEFSTPTDSWSVRGSGS